MLRLSAFLKFRGAKNLPKKRIFPRGEIFNSMQTSNNLDIQKKYKVKISSKKQTNILGHVSCS